MGPGSRPVSFIKNIYANYFWACRLTANIWLTSRPQIINIITIHSPIYWSTMCCYRHTNNYLIQLIPLNKTGQLPGPTNFPNNMFAHCKTKSLIFILFLFTQRWASWIQWVRRKTLMEALHIQNQWLTAANMFMLIMRESLMTSPYIQH